MYKLGYATYNAKKPMEANKGYVKDYLKDKVIDTHDDHDLGSFMFTASPYKTLAWSCTTNSSRVTRTWFFNLKAIIFEFTSSL